MSYCDDGGTCHHGCTLNCYRRSWCEPISGVFPNDEWPAPSGVEVHETDPTAKPTPTPSITVGTQVRLTGEVVDSEPDADGDYAVVVDGANLLYRKVYFKAADLRNLEVIRQPFKRGEVVYFEDHGIAYVVLEDEQNGRMLLIEASEGKYATYVDAANYQRRPSRLKEER